MPGYVRARFEVYFSSIARIMSVITIHPPVFIEN